MVALLTATAFAALVLAAKHLGFASDLSDASIVIILLFIVAAYLLSHFITRALTRRKVDLFFRQYVPSQLSNHYMRNPGEIGLGGDRGL